MFPLGQWRNLSHPIPRLAFLARGILCRQGTSAPCERVFSSSRWVFSYLRESMSPEVLCANVFIGCNAHFHDEFINSFKIQPATPKRHAESPKSGTAKKPRRE